MMPGMPSRHRARHAARSPVPFLAVALALVVLGGALAAVRLGAFEGDEAGAPSPVPTGSGDPTPSATPSPSPDGPSPTPSPTPSPEPINGTFTGMTTFRGNATRSWYGQGPVPSDPRILWRYPAEGSLCSTSSDQHGARLWCGTGWTGQPNVLVAEDGSIEVRINAYDGAYHFPTAARASRCARSCRPATSRRAPRRAIRTGTRSTTRARGITTSA
jgi:hypothetical protein